MVPSSRHGFPRHYVWGALGALISLIAFVAWFQFVRQDPELVSTAVRLKYNPENYIATRKLADKVTANQSITEAEWKDLVKFCNDNNSDFRARNIALLDHMKGTGHQAEALLISKKYINDPDEGVQTIAMDNIQRLNDPEWRQIIESKRSSGSALVRERADMILEKNR